MRPSYLPWLQRLTVYLASTIFPPRNLETAQPIAAFTTAAEADKEAVLTKPSGEVEKAKVVKRGTRGVVEFKKTQRPGLYTLQLPSGAPIHYVVNADRRESNLAKLTEKEIGELARAHGVSLVRSAAEYKQVEQKRRFGTELWKWLLWALLIFVIAEMVLQQIFAGVRSRPRSAVPGSPIGSPAFMGGATR